MERGMGLRDGAEGWGEGLLGLREGVKAGLRDGGWAGLRGCGVRWKIR